MNSINQTYEIAENSDAYNYRTLQVLEQLREQVGKGIKGYISDIHKTYTNHIRIALIERYSCSGAVYTQTTDVEGEVNGLLTYDRKVIRTDVPKWQKMIKDIYKAAKSRA